MENYTLCQRGDSDDQFDGVSETDGEPRSIMSFGAYVALSSPPSV